MEILQSNHGWNAFFHEKKNSRKIFIKIKIEWRQLARESQFDTLESDLLVHVIGTPFLVNKILCCKNTYLFTEFCTAGNDSLNRFLNKYRISRGSYCAVFLVEKLVDMFVPYTFHLEFFRFFFCCHCHLFSATLMPLRIRENFALETFQMFNSEHLFQKKTNNSSKKILWKYSLECSFYFCTLTVCTAWQKKKLKTRFGI